MSMSSATIDSIVSFNNSQGESARGTLRGLSRQSLSLEVYNPYSVAQLSEMLSEVTIRRQGRIVYQGSAVVTTLINTGIYLMMSATLTDPWIELNDLHGDDAGVQQEIGRFMEELDRHKNVRSGFSLSVTNLRNLLSEMSRWLEQIDLISASKDNKLELIEKLQEPILPRLFDDLMRFEEETKLVEPEYIDIHRAYCQRDLHPLTMRSPFVHRTYTKPLGYAGDYEMVNMIFRNPNEGPNTYFQTINKLFLSEGPAVAHRNRIAILLERLERAVDEANKENRGLKILNLGCGPAIEIQKLMHSRNLDQRIEFKLIDFSQPTLDYAQSQLEKHSSESGSTPTIRYVKQSVDQILRQSASLKTEESDEYDFVYSAGLFDYFSQRACQRVMKLFTHLVKPGGMIFATNVHSNNPAQAVMEYIAEWHLVCRDERDMHDLIPGYGIQRVYTDESGVNVFIEVDKPKN